MVFSKVAQNQYRNQLSFYTVAVNNLEVKLRNIPGLGGLIYC